MSRLAIIFQREYTERIRSRSFLLSTILTPLFLTLFAIGPALTDTVGSEERSYLIVVIDETEQYGPRAVQLLTAARASGGRISAEGGLGPVLDTKEDLRVRAEEGSIDGFVWIPEDIDRSSQFEIHLRPEVVRSARAEVGTAVSFAVQRERLRAAGLQDDAIGFLFAPVTPVMYEVGAEPEDGAGDGEGGIFLALVIGFVLYTLILLYGTQVMHSVQEEKTSRIAEVLVVSVHPMELMLGKVFGVGAAALTQLAIWAFLARLGYGARASLSSLGIPMEPLETLVANLDAVTLATAILFLLLGFFLYATLFAAVGAAAASTEDAQRFTFPLIMPLFVPMFLAGAITEAPRGTAATVLTWIPFTAPLVVPMRIGANGVGTGEVIASLIVLALGVLAVGWMAGKIYRVGILMAGSRPSIRDLVRWARMA